MYFDSDSDDLFWAFAGVFFGGWSFFKGFRLLRNKRLIENTPTSKCRSVAMGMVEVSGKAAGDSTVPSLIGQLPSYCSYVRIERWEKRGKSHSWVKKHEEQIGVPFYVEDETGRVKVNPEGAEFELISDVEYETEDGLGSLLQIDFDLFGGERKEKSRTLADPSSFQRFCASRGVGYSGRMRFIERNLCPGDPVYVLGTAQEAAGVRDAQQRIIIQKGKHHPWFFIAEYSQKDLLKQFGRRTWLHVFGGAGLSVACLAWLLFRLGQL